MYRWLNITKFLYHFNRRHTGQIKPHEYFLNYTYTPFKAAFLSTDTIHLIRPHQLANYFYDLWKNEKYGKINHNLAQRLIKSHILLMYLEGKRSWYHFAKQAKYFFNNVNGYYQDHKYSEIYEQGIINKLVQIFKMQVQFNKQANVVDFCIHLDRVISYNQKLLNQIWNISNQLNIKLDYQKNEQLRSLSIYKSFERRPIPQRLFKIINQPIQYTRSYNIFRLKNRQNYFQQTFMKNSQMNIKTNIDQYSQIIQKQAKLFKNVRLTQWDYLISIQFILSKGHYNSNLFQRVKDYIDKNREFWKQQAYLSQGTHLFQSILLCNILQHIVRNFDSYNLQDNASKKFLKSSFSSSYQFYTDKLAESLETITFSELYHVLSNNFKIFNKYLLTTFDDEQTLNRFKDIYFQLFKKILDFSENGILLIESAGEINFIFEIILSIFTIEDQEKVQILMQKYEKILILNPRIQQKSVSNFNQSVYIVCVKYGFKSDVFSQKLLTEIDLGLYTKSLKMEDLKSFQLCKGINEIDSLFKYFLYISLVQSKTSQYDIVDQLWKKGFSSIYLRPKKQQNIMQLTKQTRRKYLQALPQKNLTISNSRASFINLILFMMSRLLQEDKNEDLIKQRYFQLCRNQNVMSLIRQQIAFPNILHNFINIFDLLQVQDPQIIQIINQTKRLILQSYNPSEFTSLKTYQRVYYQQFNNNLCEFALFVEDFTIYRGKNLSNLVKSNPRLEQLIKQFKSTQIPISQNIALQQSQLNQQDEQQLLNWLDDKDKSLNKLIQSNQSQKPTKLFFKSSSRSQQEKIQSQQSEKPAKMFFKGSSRSLQEKIETITAKNRDLIKNEQRKNKILDKRQQKYQRKAKNKRAKDQEYFSKLKELLQKINSCFNELKVLKTATYPEPSVVKQIEIQEIKTKSKKNAKPKAEKTKSQLLKKIQTLRKSKSSSKK